MPIDFWVADTVVTPVWDTIYAGGESDPCLALAVGNNGNWGAQGRGQVNMDFFNYTDCDDLEPGEDTIPGNTEIYAYDASPVVCWQEGDSVLCNWSIFGDGYLSEHGFFPMAHVPVTDMGDYDMYQSRFVTRDTSIEIEKYWVAPKIGPDSCRFLIEVLKVHVIRGSYTNLAIGEIIDWDIPADSGSRNNSGFDESRRLIYQQGSEYDDDPQECQENDDRYGGISMVDIIETDGSHTTDFWGCYAIDNATQVYPSEGLEPDSVWKYMGDNEGYSAADSTDNDLHTVMTFRWGYALDSCDVIKIYKCLVTGKDGFAVFVDDVDKCHQFYWCHLADPYDPVIVSQPDDSIDFPGGVESTFDIVAEDPHGCSVPTVVADSALPDGATFLDNGNGSGTFTWTPDTSLICNTYEIVVKVELGNGSVIIIRVKVHVGAATCCKGTIRGNVDYSDPDIDEATHGIDISDLVYLVDYMFTGGPAPECVPEANMDASGTDLLADIDISDLVYLVDFMFTGGPLPLPCL
jgi:hypothetical protein